MEERNITITIDNAREWYNSETETLKKIALQAFSENELKFDFRNITTFKKACEVLNHSAKLKATNIKNFWNALKMK